VGDSALTRRLLGLLGHAISDDSSLFLDVGGGEGRSLVDRLVRSSKRYAKAPWLLLVNRGLFEGDRRFLVHVIPGEGTCCFVLFRPWKYGICGSRVRF
jgi:hypothetical protein